MRDFLTTLPGGFWVQFAIVMGVIFLLGFFLDFIEIAVVVVPIVAPILLADPSANVTAVWLGVMIGLNIQTSFLTPPFGFALFYLRGVAPSEVRTTEIYRGVVAFIGLQLLVLAIVAVNPSLVNYLPNRVSLTAETAPPPLNPRLQYCMEQQLFDDYATNGATIQSAIEQARGLDLSALPSGVRRDVEKALAKAANTFDLVDGVNGAYEAVNEAAPGYRPLHAQVRSLERRARQIAAEVKVLDRELGRMRDEAEAEARARLEARVAALEAEREALLAEIPDEWDSKHDAFEKLKKAEEQARSKYRRNVDEAYGPIAEVIELLGDTDRLAALGPGLEALRQSVATSEPAASVDVIAAFSRDVGSVSGTRDIRRALSKARRAVRNKEPSVSKALEELESARALLEKETAWRENAPCRRAAGPRVLC